MNTLQPALQTIPTLQPLTYHFPLFSFSDSAVANEFARLLEIEKNIMMLIHLKLDTFHSSLRINDRPYIIQDIKSAISELNQTRTRMRELINAYSVPRIDIPSSALYDISIPEIQSTPSSGYVFGGDDTYRSQPTNSLTFHHHDISRPLDPLEKYYTLTTDPHAHQLLNWIKEPIVENKSLVRQYFEIMKYLPHIEETKHIDWRPVIEEFYKKCPSMRPNWDSIEQKNI